MDSQDTGSWTCPKCGLVYKISHWAAFNMRRLIHPTKQTYQTTCDCGHAWGNSGGTVVIRHGRKGQIT